MIQTIILSFVLVGICKKSGAMDNKILTVDTGWGGEGGSVVFKGSMRRQKKKNSCEGV
jgi:hypothetical protein